MKVKSVFTVFKFIFHFIVFIEKNIKSRKITWQSSDGRKTVQKPVLSLKSDLSRLLCERENGQDVIGRSTTSYESDLKYYY